MHLSEILEGFDDDAVDEPAIMDRILMYVEEIKEEDEQFMELLIDRLVHKEILWEQPWYQQSNSVSRPLKKKNGHHTETYKTDTICKAENDLLLENWREFIQEFDIPDRLICLARWKNTVKCKLPNSPQERTRRYVLSYLARGLERTIFQVYRHIQTYFGGPSKGPYSYEEERIMDVCFTQHPNNCVTLLSLLLGREPRGIYKRLQQMYNGKPEKKRIKWTLPLATKFVRLLMKYTGLPLDELKNKKFDREVWLKMEKKFDHLYIYLEQFWYKSLHVQLFVRDSIKIRKLRKKIFKTLKSTSYQIWSDIRWKDVVKQLPDGYTHYFIYKLIYGIIHKKPKYHKKPLNEVIDYGLSRLNYNRKRRLRTLRLNKNRELEQVIYKNGNVSRVSN